MKNPDALKAENALLTFPTYRSQYDKDMFESARVPERQQVYPSKSAFPDDRKLKYMNSPKAGTSNVKN